jgi:hypothetical protein
VPTVGVNLTSASIIRLLLIATIASSVVIGTFFLYASGRLSLTLGSYDGIPKAAIIDQLHDDIPNTHFQEKAAEYLSAAGYQVDLYTTEAITVDFYKNLPNKGYKFIVIRSHSGIGPGTQQTIENTLGIFTGEKYDEKKYTFEQILGWVQKSKAFTNEYEAVVEREGTEMTLTNSEESDTYFSIGSKFINEYMIGKFPGSIVIIGGCNTLENTSLADSLVKRGASSIIGWDSLVEAGHNDRVILETMRSMLVDKADPKEAVGSAMQIYGPDPQYSAELNYYPRDFKNA